MRKVVSTFLVLLLLSSCGPKSKVHPVSDNIGRYPQNTNRQALPRSGKTSIPMRREGGVCYVMVKINGIDMEVIFDTGASDVVISSVEAMFLLKQGKLTEDDILGTSYYQVANGSISSGTVVNLHSVQIGTKVLSNVRATVVDNMTAPLLLGQSVLGRLSSVIIDYSHNVINIE
ncbi:MAG: retroviral-like aspartic protease family protein [Bacteroidales bacterium]|nr:retroviral-like aspartic protease family protein [Bacteroidales bacterium]